MRQPLTACLLSICCVASEIEEPNFLCYLTLTDLHLNGHIWLVANVLDSTGLEGRVKDSLY